MKILTWMLIMILFMGVIVLTPKSDNITESTSTTKNYTNEEILLIIDMIDEK